MSVFVFKQLYPITNSSNLALNVGLNRFMKRLSLNFQNKFSLS